MFLYDHFFPSIVLVSGSNLAASILLLTLFFILIFSIKSSKDVGTLEI